MCMCRKSDFILLDIKTLLENQNRETIYISVVVLIIVFP